MPVRSVRSLRDLDPPTQGAVLALVGRALESDGVRPLSEQSLLAVEGRSSHRPTHLLAYASTHLVGYAQLDDDDAAELVVNPGDRRRGVASALLETLPTDARIWAHGDLDAAEAFAAARGLVVVRELWKLGRPFAGRPPLAPVELPAGLVARSFRPGHDEDEWLRVNAAAFAHHPEQGRVSRADLDARMAEDWFDPAGLKLVVLADEPDHVVASHWTKIPRRRDGGAHAPGSGREASRPPDGGAHAPGSGREASQPPHGGAHAPGSGREASRPPDGGAHAPGSGREASRPPDGGAHAPGSGREASRARSGEVYVVAVDPAYQGRGLGTPLTLLGLHHLQDRGVDDVVLYVDGDNPAALRLYRKLGFETRSVDRMYRRPKPADVPAHNPADIPAAADSGTMAP